MRGIMMAIAALLVLRAAPADAEWLRAESPNFIVYGDVTRARMRERVTLLEAYDRFLRILTATTVPPSPNKLRVYLTRGSQLQYVAPLGNGVAGFYRATPDAVLAVTDEFQNWVTNEDDTLLHEYAHHFMEQYHPAPYPIWYSEGFAEYVATVQIRPDRIEYGNFNPNRALWLARRDQWINYEQLLFGDPRKLNAYSFYAQSWLLVHYIMAEESRRAAFVRYVEALARGEAAPAAFTAAFGMDASALDRAMHDYAHRITFHRLTRSGADPVPPIRIDSIAGVGIDSPLVEAALLVGVAEGRQRELLADARRAGRHDAYGRRVQARAEVLYGDAAAADRLLDGLLAAAPNDAELLYLKGLRHLVAGRRDAAARPAEYRLAQPFFARAFHADPNHYPALFRYAEALSAGDQLLTDNGENILLLAVTLAPQVREIRLAAAHLLLLRDKFEQAEALLLPLSGSLHQGDPGRGDELLRLARARQRPADTDVFKTSEGAAAAQPVAR